MCSLVANYNAKSDWRANVWTKNGPLFGKSDIVGEPQATG